MQLKEAKILPLVQPYFTIPFSCFHYFQTSVPLVSKATPQLENMQAKLRSSISAHGRARQSSWCPIPRLGTSSEPASVRIQLLARSIPLCWAYPPHKRLLQDFGTELGASL